MIQVNSLLEYFIGLKQTYTRDEMLQYYYDKQINKCKKLLICGIEYTTFKQYEELIWD